eukprot:TRINITY_DN681_c0_g2_i1.p2 TRINITY_DN681_c0_g2~~TRINITY_DN681_c0_g2_i1.p2  ORF type:complete len:705 (-),score=238.75 TRINITY_DN681_c0_g2_i1:831-2945(-)
MEDVTIAEEDRSLFAQEVIDRILELNDIDAKEVGSLVLECFADENERVMEKLDQHPRLLFDYLGGLFDLDGGNRRMDDASGLDISSDVHERYIELMCEYRPDPVFDHLTTHGRYPYRLDHCLQLCRTKGLTKATAHLLERTGDIEGALSLILSDMGDKLKSMEKKQNTGDATAQEMRIARDGVQDTLNMASSLCQRNADTATDEETQKLWFMLLDLFAGPVQEIRHRKVSTDSEQKKGFARVEVDGPMGRARSISRAGFGTGAIVELNKVNYEEVLVDCLDMVLTQMMGFVPMQTILARITANHGQDQFSEFKSLIETMIATYRYEMRLLKTANQIINRDVFRSSRTLVRRLQHATTARSSECGICELNLFDNTQTVTVYNCGHGFHQNCSEHMDHCHLCHRNVEKRKSRYNPNRSRASKRQEQSDEQASEELKSRGRSYSVATAQSIMASKQRKYARRMNRFSKRLEQHWEQEEKLLLPIANGEIAENVYYQPSKISFVSDYHRKALKEVEEARRRKERAGIEETESTDRPTLPSQPRNTMEIGDEEVWEIVMESEDNQAYRDEEERLREPLKERIWFAEEEEGLGGISRTGSNMPDKKKTGKSRVKNLLKRARGKKNDSDSDEGEPDFDDSDFGTLNSSSGPRRTGASRFLVSLDDEDDFEPQAMPGRASSSRNMPSRTGSRARRTQQVRPPAGALGARRNR